MARRDREAARVRETEVALEDDEAPYVEARGPHLPDALGRLPWLAWVFILLAIGDFAWFIVNAGLGSASSLGDFATYVLRVVPSVTAVLLPAVLLARHPDATRRAPTLLLGLVLYALVQGLLILSQPLQGFFEKVTPASEELPGLVPLAAIYDGLSSLIGAFGVLYVAVGLARARRFVDRSGPLTALLVPVAGVIASILGVVAVSRIDLGGSGISMSPTLAIYLGGNVILSILPVVVWAYLTTVGVRGWQAGEDPIAGWRFVALGGGLVIVALALVDVGGLLTDATVSNETIYRLYGYTIAVAYSLGHLCLLAAFLVGLPALDDEDYEDFEDGEDFEDDDVEFGPGRDSID